MSDRGERPHSGGKDTEQRPQSAGKDSTERGMDNPAYTGDTGNTGDEEGRGNGAPPQGNGREDRPPGSGQGDRGGDKKDTPPPAVYAVETDPANSAGGKPMNGGTGNGDVTANMEQLDDVEKEKQRKRDKDPLKFITLITNHTGICFGVLMGGHVFLLLITAILMQTGYDIIPLEFDRLPLDIRDDVDYLRQLSWQERFVDENKVITRGIGEAGEEGAKVAERTDMNEVFDMIFELEGGNVFTPENLKAIKAVEDAFLALPDYKEKYCLLEGSSCQKPMSIIRVFDGSHGQPADLQFSNIAGYLSAVNATAQGRLTLVPFLGKDAVITPTSASSSITRSKIAMGYPLKSYDNSSHKADEQKEKYRAFLSGEWKTLAERYYTDKVGPDKMGFFFQSFQLFGITILTQVPMDLALAIGSFIYVAIFMIIQVRSLWITFMSLFSIITSFLGANLVYRVFLDYRYFGIFHVLSLFIILGIGADDIFVFLDTWRDSRYPSYKSLAHRMSDVYRKASVAMLFTSLTTAIAFFVSAGSPFLGVSSFGVFSGILVLVNYISVITFFPCAVLMYHKHFEKFTCCCCCPRPQVTPQASPGGRAPRKNVVVEFLKGPYFRFVTHKIASIVILVVFVIILGVFIYFASQLKVNEDQIKFFKDNTNPQQYADKTSVSFSSLASDTSAKVYIVFGLKPQDISDCHKTDPACFGKTVWDDNFSLDSRQAQADILTLCSDLRAMSSADADRMSVRRSLADGVTLEVDCFLSDMRDTTFYKAGIYPNYPYEADDWTELSTRRPNVYTDPLPADFKDYFALSMGYWMFDEFNGTKINRRKYGPSLGEVKTTNTKTVVYPATGGETIMYGTRLRWAAISINTTLEAVGVHYKDGLEVRDAWEDWVKDKLDKMATKSQLGGYQCTYGFWHWFKVQQKLVTSAVTGVAIGLAVALPILVIATHNVLVGLLATLIICCITVSVIGVIPMAGWTLGLLESLNLVLVVGLAVDYVVHLAEGYSRSAHTDRKGRVRDALEEVGISVLSGACTTLGASFFLLFTVILFFTQFGIFMFSTIALSICYSLGLFITMLGLFGPQGETGSLKPLYRKIAACCCKKKEGFSPNDQNC